MLLQELPGAVSASAPVGVPAAVSFADASSAAKMARHVALVQSALADGIALFNPFI